MSGIGEVLLLAVAVSAGCSLQVPFELAWQLPVAGSSGALGAEVPMDLSDQAALWDRRDDVLEVDVESVRLLVVRIGKQNRAGATSLALHYRPEGADSTGEADVALVDVGSLTLSESVVIEAEVQPGLGAALGGALRGDGRFSLVVSGAADAPIDAVVELMIGGVAVVQP